MLYVKTLLSKHLSLAKGKAQLVVVSTTRRMDIADKRLMRQYICETGETRRLGESFYFCGNIIAKMPCVGFIAILLCAEVAEEPAVSGNSLPTARNPALRVAI